MDEDESQSWGGLPRQGCDSRNMQGGRHRDNRNSHFDEGTASKILKRRQEDSSPLRTETQKRQDRRQRKAKSDRMQRQHEREGTKAYFLSVND